MGVKEISDKIRRRVWDKIVTYSRSTPFYPYIYGSFWYSKFARKGTENIEQYFSSVPNPGAGIGHQMANWIAGYWFAQLFGIKFAHIPFSNKIWEDFLGFGNNETQVNELVKNGKYRKVKLPLFNEGNPIEVNLIRNIISVYKGQKVILVTEQDQFYKDQFGVQDIIKQKFYSTPSRRDQKLIYSKYYFNIAIHVRRGDIVSNDGTVNENFNMRFQQNDYFFKVLLSVILNLKVSKPVMIYLFSQGEIDSFNEFKEFNNIHFCLDMSAINSFLHMVYADLIITSKSSFSYKPALLSNGIKICPANFWHGYPKNDQWILADDNGKFNIQKLNIIHD